MILRAQSIRHRCGAEGNKPRPSDWKPMVVPCHEKTILHGMSYGVSPAGYDIRVAEAITLFGHGFTLASSVELFNMPNDVLGRVADKSSWARLGIAVQNTVIEPGWRGYLTLELSNNYHDVITIQAGSPIAQVIFELLDGPTDTPYEGKYQDQPAGVVKARWEE